MSDTQDLQILPEDRVQLTQDQKNLIELAFEKQVPPEDAEFIEKVQKEAQTGGNPFTRLSEYFTAKYGLDFGMILLSAIMGGREKYQETVDSIEKLRAQERVRKQKIN